jgi:hypothetical protein
MDRQQRREYFDRLCSLRDGYGRLGLDDTLSVITIEAMIERAIELLEAPGAPLIVVADGSSQAA